MRADDCKQNAGVFFARQRLIQNFRRSMPHSHQLQHEILRPAKAARHLKMPRNQRDAKRQIVRWTKSGGNASALNPAVHKIGLIANSLLVFTGSGQNLFNPIGRAVVAAATNQFGKYFTRYLRERLQCVLSIERGDSVKFAAPPIISRRPDEFYRVAFQKSASAQRRSAPTAGVK